MNLQPSLRTKQRFFQFGLRQLFVLFAAAGLLLSILAPGLHRAYREREFQAAFRRSQQAQADLVSAVRDNDLDLARHALDRGAKANNVVDHPSLLHLSIVNGHIPMMELLLDAGADIERHGFMQLSARDVYGRPLHVAISCPQPVQVRLKMVRLLVGRGADIRSEVARRNAMDFAVVASDAEVGAVLREYGLPYGPREMAAFDRLDELAAAVKENPGLLRQRYRPVYAARPGEGPTLLGLALERGYRQMAEFLIESGAPLDTTENLGQTPLHMAARVGDPELIRLLAARGADVNARDDYQETPLIHVAWQGKPAAIAALIEMGADVNSRGMLQATPLHRAVGNNRDDAVRLLLAAGADPTVPDRNGETPLDVARKKNVSIVKLLEEATAGGRHLERK